VYVDPLIKQYIVDLVTATREHEDAALGASPRASLALMRGAQSQALMGGRDYASPDDVKRLAVPVMAHRMILSPSARMRGLSAEALVEQVLRRVPVPGADTRGPRGA
jgi:MoxR-like ATPase